MLVHDTVYVARYFVLHKLPNLKFLDSKQVKKKEREEGLRRGAFLKVIAPEEQTDVSVRKRFNQPGRILASNVFILILFHMHKFSDWRKEPREHEERE